MGRRKIAIAPIADERARAVTFGKRKTGLFKKAYELSVLCNCEIALIVFASNGKSYEFSSHGMDASLHRYSLTTEAPTERKGPSDYADFAAGTLPKKGVARGGSKVPAREQTDDEDEEDDYDDEVERKPTATRKRSAVAAQREDSSDSYQPSAPPRPQSVGSSHTPAPPAPAPMPPPPFMPMADPAVQAAMMAHYYPQSGPVAPGSLPPHIPSGVFLPPPFLGISTYAQQAAALQQQAMQYEAMRINSAGAGRPTLRVQTEHPQAGPSTQTAASNGVDGTGDAAQYASALRSGSDQPDPVFGFAERTPLSATDRTAEVGLQDYLAFFQSPQAQAAAAMAPLQYQQAQFQADAFRWPVFNPAALAPRDALQPSNPMDSLADASVSRKRSIEGAEQRAAAEAGQPSGGDGADVGGADHDAKRLRTADQP